MQKAVCLQFIYDRCLAHHWLSLILKADLDQMTPLIRGCPDPLKFYAIHTQDCLRAVLALGRQMEHTQAEFTLTWRKISQELLTTVVCDIRREPTGRSCSQENGGRKHNSDHKGRIQDQIGINSG